MSTDIIFYSWQSDLPNKTNRSLIGEALARAATRLSNSSDDTFLVDQDTRDEPGSPNIGSTILRKIDLSSVFVADVSFIHSDPSYRKTPNPNVLVELGYALKSLGEKKVIMILNTATGSVNDLPFDLRFKRALTYSMSPEDQPAEIRNHLTEKLVEAIQLVIKKTEQEAQSENLGHYAGRVAEGLASFLVLGEQMAKRSLDPWYEDAQIQFQSLATEFRDLAIEPEADELEIAGQLRSLAERLDPIVNHVRVAGREAWEEYLAMVQSAVEAALELKQLLVDDHLTDDMLTEIEKALRDHARRAVALSEEAKRQLDSDSFRGWRELRDRAASVGAATLRLSYFMPEGEEAELLRSIARRLHQVELLDQRVSGSREIKKVMQELIEIAPALSDSVS